MPALEARAAACSRACGLRAPARHGVRQGEKAPPTRHDGTEVHRAACARDGCLTLLEQRARGWRGGAAHDILLDIVASRCAVVTRRRRLLRRQHRRHAPHHGLIAQRDHGVHRIAHLLLWHLVRVRARAHAHHAPFREIFMAPCNSACAKVRRQRDAPPTRRRVYMRDGGRRRCSRRRRTGGTPQLLPSRVSLVAAWPWLPRAVGPGYT